MWILWKVSFSKCEFLDKLRIFVPVCSTELKLEKSNFSPSTKISSRVDDTFLLHFPSVQEFQKRGEEMNAKFSPQPLRERNFQVIRPKRWFFMTRQHFGSLCRTPSKARPRIYAEMCKCDKSGWWMPSRFPSLTWRLDAASWLQAGVGKTANPFMGNHHHLLNLS